jgi:uncharacterized protein (TIGR03435 family)
MSISISGVRGGIFCESDSQLTPGPGGEHSGTQQITVSRLLLCSSSAFLAEPFSAVTAKLKNADPTGRTGCKTANATSGTATATPFGGLNLPGRTVTCLNMTMAQFADQLQTLAGNYVHYPVTDSTGLEGAWDFSFTYSPINPIQLAGLRGAPPPGVTDPGASDPVGGTSLMDAVEKQLGLKLEMQKRLHPVLVIDHMEQKPTDN